MFENPGRPRLDMGHGLPAKKQRQNICCSYLVLFWSE